MKVMIAAGGTGGHIYPALALAEVLKKKEPDSEVIFFGSDDRMEAKVIPEHGYKFYGMHVASTYGGLGNKVKSVFSMMKTQKQAEKILKEEKPDICVGFGNYISVPLIEAAHHLHIPTMIHEQNSFAGKANRFLSGKVDAIVGCYESNLKEMPAEKQRILGNPEATLAADTVFDPEILTKMGLQKDKPFVIFMMGSLGSSSVSKVIDEACPLFDDSYQCIIASGTSNDYHFQYPSNDHIKITEYVDGKAMLKGCSLAVLRAGATTMAEAGAIGCASVLIPSPYVPNNHQFYNASELVKKDAAVMIEEKDLTPQLLADTVNGLMKDPDRLQKMRDNARKQGKRDAAYQMIDWMEELIHD